MKWICVHCNNVRYPILNLIKGVRSKVLEEQQQQKPNKNKKDEGRVFSLALSSETYSFIAFLGWQLRTGYLDLSSTVRRRL